MGIKDLNKILKTKCESALNTRPLSAYMGYRVAIDTSIFLYKFMYVYGNIVDGLVRLTVTLLNNGILPVYVLDGKPPKEKMDLLNERKEKREEMILTAKILRDITDAKDENPELLKGDIDVLILESYQKNVKLKKGEGEGEKVDGESPSIMVNKILSVNDWDILYNGQVDEMEKYREGIERKIIQIRKEHIEDVKKLMSLFGVPCIIAQSEAESLCAVLCKKKIVDAVLSEDMDVLATGGTVLLKNFSMEKGGSVTEVCLEGVLNGLDLSYDQFLDMCILCGCDYTTKIGGIGPMHALKLVKTYGSIEGAMPYILKKYKVPTDFDYVTSRQLFKEACCNDDFEKYKCDVLQTPIQYEELVKFIQEKAPKLKGKPMTDLEGLSKEYKNEKKMMNVVEKGKSLKKVDPIKTIYQPTLDNYFKMAEKAEKK
jgi:5'-3' exonuclease